MPSPPSERRFRIAVRLGDPAGHPELLERYRLELADADPIELVLETRGEDQSAALARTLCTLGFGLHGSPRAVTREAGGEPEVSTAREEDLLASDRLLDEARAATTILGPADLGLLGRLGGVSTLLIGGDRESVAALRSATEAAGAPLVARGLAPGLARGADEERPPAFHGEELAAHPSFAYLDPDYDKSAGWLFGLANVLSTGSLVALPQTTRGIALGRNALASALFVLEERGDALMVLRRVTGARPHPALPTAEQASADVAATERLVQAAVKPDWNCIDVGASKGDVLRLLLGAAPEAAHHAFEPLPHRAAALRRAFPTVVVHDLALSDRSGRSSFVHVRAADAYSGLFRRPGSPEGEVSVIEVETARLDDVLPEGHRFSLVKIDTEGGEGRVIAGGIETLARDRPIVVFEHGLGASLAYGVPSCDLWDALAGDCRLQIYALDGHGPYSRSEFCGPKLHWNFVAVRPELARLVVQALSLADVDTARCDLTNADGAG